MTESEFRELRDYAETESSCIDMGYRPMTSVIRKGWLTEIVSGCWAITESGRQAFRKVTDGTSELIPDREPV